MSTHGSFVDPAIVRHRPRREPVLEWTEFELPWVPPASWAPPAMPADESSDTVRVVALLAVLVAGVAFAVGSLAARVSVPTVELSAPSSLTALAWWLAAAVGLVGWVLVRGPGLPVARFPVAAVVALAGGTVAGLLVAVWPALEQMARGFQVMAAWVGEFGPVLVFAAGLIATAWCVGRVVRWWQGVKRRFRRSMSFRGIL